MARDSKRIYELASRQHGLLTREDLTQLGATVRARRTLMARGTLEPLGRQVYRVGGSPRTAHQRVLAGCLEVGGLSSCSTAIWLHRIRGGRPGSPPQVTVDRQRFDYRVELAEVHTTTFLPEIDRVVVDGIPCFAVARALFSLAAVTPRSELDVVRNAVDEAVRDGKAIDAWLWWRLEKIRRRGRPGVDRFQEVLVERQGGNATESWLEREFLRILRAAGLPLPACQERVGRSGAFVARVDFLYRGLDLVIEVSGHVHHSTREQLGADAARRNRLMAEGLTVLEFTFDDIVRSPERVVDMVTRMIYRDPTCRPSAA